MKVLDYERDFVLDPSCILYVPLWKKDGPQFMSEDGYGKFCTRAGSLWTPKGDYFDGVDDKVDINQETSRGIIGASCITLITWVNLKQTPDDGQMMFSLQNATGGTRLSINTSTNRKIYFGARSETEAFQGGTHSTALVPGEWTAIALIADLPDQSFDIIRNYDIETATGKTFANSTFQDSTNGNNYIGCAGGGGEWFKGFNGYVGESILFIRRLNHHEIFNYIDVTKWRYV